MHGIKCLFIVLFSYGRALLLNTLIRQVLAVEFSTKLNCVRFQIERAQAIQMLGKIQTTLNPPKILYDIQFKVSVGARKLYQGHGTDSTY